MDEFGLIEAIGRCLGENGEHVRMGIGDDAAVLASFRGDVVLSTDAAVEGVHFKRDWLSWRQLGNRSYVSALSDLAAMGASARAGLWALAVPSELTSKAILEIAEGVGAAAKVFDAPIVGGNVTSGAGLSLTFTVVGETSGELLRRDAARDGDGIYVTGVLGAAALGLRCLQQGILDDAVAPFLSAWRTPTPRFDWGMKLRGRAHSAIDVSDGLVQDLNHLCRASGVGARVAQAQLPILEGSPALAARLGEDAYALALRGGEDYELLFTACSSLTFEGVTRIGTIVPGRGVQVHRSDGTLVPVDPGFRHR